MKKNIKLNDDLSTGLGTSSMQSSTLKIKTLEIAGKPLKNTNLVLLDLSHINQTYTTLGFKPIDGVLGNDILYKLKARICFDAKTIVFYT